MGLRILRIAFNLLDNFLLILFLLFLVFIYKIRIPVPDIDTSITPASYTREIVGENHYKVGSSWLKKNDEGIWEMYLEGAPYERGVIYGVLAKEIVESQEVSFVNQIDELIPSRFFQHFLQVFIAWFNRDMDEYISEENKEEIYGISRSFSDEYDYIGPKFYRILYYHAAHDIGHALADLRIVGCTSFSVNGASSEDGELLIGRNFDFYMGDEFSKDKLLLFLNPTEGYKFTTYSWAGFTGVVSGMNEKGLTVTINASKSDIPLTAKTPISLLAREILQKCKSIEEAIILAGERQTFVSESILIGSAYDDDVAIIEKSPTKMGVYQPEENVMVCANHYQSDVFINDSVNIKNIEESDSKFRYDRMLDLIETKAPLNYREAAAILRNKEGINGEDIGLGNPKSLNQLIAHHAVLFKPKSRQIWVSSAPFQLGDILCYDLNKAFADPQHIAPVNNLHIQEDPFLHSEEYKQFEYFKEIKKNIIRMVMMGKELTLSPEEVGAFIASNPQSFEVYFNLGRYYEAKGAYCDAMGMYKLSLTKVVASKREEEQIKSMVKAMEKQCNTTD